MINLKKLVYQYKYLKLDLDELKEQHSELTIEFEEEFSNILKREGQKDVEIPNPKKKKKSKHADESVKDIYKKAAKQLHPDKGGNEEDFKELNDRYKSNDLLGVIDMAVDNKIEFTYVESDVELMNNSVKTLETQIDEYRNKLCYVWKFGTPMERLNVINTLAQHLGKRIDVKDLTEKQKKKLGLDLEK
jgi:hypothetical protein